MKPELEAKIERNKSFGGHDWYWDIEDVEEMATQLESLAAALQELVHLHGCEQEGMGSPSPEKWFDAVDKSGEALTNYKKFLES